MARRTMTTERIKRPWLLFLDWLQYLVVCTIQPDVWWVIPRAPPRADIIPRRPTTRPLLTRLPPHSTRRHSPLHHSTPSPSALIPPLHLLVSCRRQGRWPPSVRPSSSPRRFARSRLRAPPRPATSARSGPSSSCAAASGATPAAPGSRPPPPPTLPVRTLLPSCSPSLLLIWSLNEEK
jgi:hypothetical protein